MKLCDEQIALHDQSVETTDIKGQSLAGNMILYAIKTISTVLFPFIAYAYASRVLDMNGIGQVEFSHSIISYFTLFAGLGVNTFAIRSGARYKDDSMEFALFANRVLSIVLISTLLSYAVLFVLMAVVPMFSQIKTLLKIQSLMIGLSAFGMEWVYVIYEKFAYIAIRSLIFQFFGLISLFVFIKRPIDHLIYATIVLIATYGPYLLNICRSRSYFKMNLTYDKDSKIYLKEIAVMFAFSIASTIYVNSDSTMIGLLSDFYYVGLYSVATKIYTAFKILLSTVMNVSLTRLSYYYAFKKIEKYNGMISELINLLIVIIFPLTVGLCFLAEPLILFIGGAKYSDAKLAMIILSITLPIATVGMMMNSTILLPQKKEKYVLVATSIGALVNILLNLFLIPIFEHVGAALTTFIAETIVMLIQGYASRNTLKQIHISIKSTLIPSLIESVIVILIFFCVKETTTSVILRLLLTFCLSVIFYLILLLLSKNSIVLSIKQKFCILKKHK